ncbi:MAG: transcription antitermination factor NusB [Terriglobales bacterium]
MLSPARVAAFEVLLKIETESAYSSELLHSDRVALLSPADRGLCMEIVMGVLRWRSRLDADIARFSFTPFRKLDLEVLTALRMGAYQLQFLERVPARAAINESVELVKHSRKASAAGLANAVLRKIPKTSTADRAALHAVAPPSSAAGPDRSSEELAREFAHPVGLVERWWRQYGGAVAVDICRFNQQVPVTALRLSDPSLEDKLRSAGAELAPGAIVSAARRVLRGDPTHTRAYSSMRVTVQDEASQLVAALVGRGRRILDCCAAPGGKTAAIADRNPEADIIAADLHAHRARLMRRLVRAANVRIIAADARALPVSGAFDRILVDAPCSGTGTLARNPEIKWRLKPADLAGLHARQVGILRGALQHLAPGGRLVYATCSLEPEENEAVIDEVLGSVAPPSSAAGPARIVDIREILGELHANGELAWPDLESLTRGPCLRTVPGVHPCDGFFAAVLEKH